MRIPNVFKFIALAAVLGGSNHRILAADLPVIAWQGRTMGSDYTVKIVDGKLSEPQVTALKAKIEATLVEVNRQISNYVPDSELSRFNRAPVNVPFNHWREDQPMAAGVSIADQALSTSGDYQKFFVDAAGRCLCHIIDARTATPLQHELAACLKCVKRLLGVAVGMENRHLACDGKRASSLFRVSVRPMK